MRLLKDESGASAAEYALILALIGTGIIFAAMFLGGKIADSVYATGNCIKTASSC